jgi:hypothetical protein
MDKLVDFLIYTLLHDFAACQRRGVRTASDSATHAATVDRIPTIKFLLCRWRPGKCGFRNSVKKNRPNVVFNTKSFYFSDLQKGSPELRFQYKKFLFFRPSERFSQNVVFNTNSFYFSDLQKGSPERRFQYK